MKDGWTALMYAAMNGYSSIVNFLVTKCEADINIVDRLGRNALHWASRYNNKKVVEMLLKLKVSFDELDIEKNNPIDIAKIYNSTDA